MCSYVKRKSSRVVLTGFYSAAEGQRCHVTPYVVNVVVVLLVGGGAIAKL